jgi:transposase
MTSKFVEGMPFYRVEHRFKRDKISISRSNMCNWAIAAADACLPLYNLFADTIKSQKTIGIDESVLQVLDEPNKTPESKSYMWLFRSNTKNLPIIYYQYDPSRGSVVPTEFLLDYKGTVQTDGYSAYGFLDYLPNITHIVCWAHARRYFIDVIKARGKSKKMKKKRQDKTGKAEEATRFIKLLYKIEKEIREADLSPEEIFKKRQRESVPVLEEFKKWLDDISLRTPKKGLLGKAISYTLNQWPRLIKYIEDGTSLIDNNLVENAIRPYVIGRKAWLFFKSQRGAEAGAIFYSLVETAKAYDLNPEHYFNHIFTELPTADTLEKLETLLPWNLTPEQIKPAHSAA